MWKGGMGVGAADWQATGEGLSGAPHTHTGTRATLHANESGRKEEKRRRRRRRKGRASLMPVDMKRELREIVQVGCILRDPEPSV